MTAVWSIRPRSPFLQIELAFYASRLPVRVAAGQELPASGHSRIVQKRMRCGAVRARRSHSMEHRLRLFYETKCGQFEFPCGGTERKVNPMTAFRNGTIALALLAGMGTAGVASPGGSAWITDGLTT